jgi:hypothetical protein
VSIHRSGAISCARNNLIRRQSASGLQEAHAWALGSSRPPVHTQRAALCPVWFKLRAIGRGLLIRFGARALSQYDPL